MKRYILPGVMVAITLIFSACKKDNNINGEVLRSPEHLAGLWVPYELIENGTVFTGNFTGNGLFGAYAESVKIESDLSFIPVIFFAQGNKTLKQDEKGTYRINGLSGKMEMNGIFKIETRVIKLTADEMWLNMWPNTANVLYKFRKQTY